MTTTTDIGNVQKKIKSRPGRPKGSINKKTRFIKTFQLDVSDFTSFNNSSTDLLLHSRCPKYFPKAPRICLRRVRQGGDRNGSRNALSLLESHLFFPIKNRLSQTEDSAFLNGGKENGDSSDEISGKGDISREENTLMANPLPSKLISDIDVTKLKITLKNFVPGRLSATSGDECTQHQSCAQVDMSCKLNNALDIDNHVNIDHKSCEDRDILNDNKEKNNVEGNESSLMEMSISCGQPENVSPGKDLMCNPCESPPVDNANVSNCELPRLCEETDNGNNSYNENCPPLLLPENSIGETEYSKDTKSNKQSRNSKEESNQEIVSNDFASDNNNDSVSFTTYTADENADDEKSSSDVSVQKHQNETNDIPTVETAVLPETTGHSEEKQEEPVNTDNKNGKRNEVIRDVANTIILHSQVSADIVKNSKSKKNGESTRERKSKLNIKQEREEVTRKPLYQHDGYDSDATVIYDDEEERRECNKKRGSVCSPTKIKQTQELLRQRSKSISLETDRQKTVKTPETMECLESLYPYRGDNIDISEDMLSITETSDNEENRLLIDEKDKNVKPKVIKTEIQKHTVKVGENVRTKRKQTSDKKNGRNNKSPKRRPSSGIKLTSTKWDQALTSCDSVTYTDLTISRNIVKKSLKNKNGKIRRQKKGKAERKKRDEKQDNVLKNINKIFPKPRRKKPKDEDDLPTILPPKRRRQGKQNQTTDSKIDMDRINQEFPRFNWLEKKYTDVSVKVQQEPDLKPTENHEHMTETGDISCTNKDVQILTQKNHCLPGNTALINGAEPSDIVPEIVDSQPDETSERCSMENMANINTIDTEGTTEQHADQDTIIQTETDLEVSTSETNDNYTLDMEQAAPITEDISLTITTDIADKDIEEVKNTVNASTSSHNDNSSSKLPAVATDEMMEISGVNVPSADGVENTIITPDTQQSNCVFEHQTCDDFNTSQCIAHDTQHKSSNVGDESNGDGSIHQSEEVAHKGVEIDKNANTSAETINTECLKSTPQNLSPKTSSYVSECASNLPNVQCDQSILSITPAAIAQSTTSSMISNNTTPVSSENVASEPLSKKMRFSEANVSQIPPLVPVSAISKPNRVGLKAKHLLGLGPEVDATYNEIKELKRKIDALNRETERFQIELKQKEEMLRSLLLSSPLAPSRQTQHVPDENKTFKAPSVAASESDINKNDKINKAATQTTVIQKEDSKIPPPAHSGNKKENTMEILKVMEQNPVPHLRSSWTLNSRKRPLSPPLRFKSNIAEVSVANAHDQKPFEHPEKVFQKPERSKSQGSETCSNQKVETSRALSAPLQDRAHASPINLRRMTGSAGIPGAGLNVSKVASNLPISLAPQINKSNTSAVPRTNFQHMSQKSPISVQRTQTSPRLNNAENEIQHELNEALKRRQKLEASKLEQDYQQFKISKPENTNHRSQLIPTQNMVETTQRNRMMQLAIPHHAVPPPQRQIAHSGAKPVQPPPPPYSSNNILTALQKTSNNCDTTTNGRSLSSISSALPQFNPLPQSVRLIGAATIPSSQINRPNEPPKSNPISSAQQQQQEHIRQAQPNAIPMNTGHYAPRVPGHLPQGAIHHVVQMTPHGMVPVTRSRVGNEVPKMFPSQVPMQTQQNIPGNPVVQQVSPRHPQLHKVLSPDQAIFERQNQVVPPNPQPHHHQHTVNREQLNHRGTISGHNIQQQNKQAVAPETGGKGQHIFGNCILCGKFSLYLCSTCQDVWYCSQQCQLKHWTTHQHECKYATK